MTGDEFEIRLHSRSGDFELNIDCSFAVGATGFFGPSGCGKTTCLEALAGLRPDVKGFIRFGDRVWLDTSKNRFVASQYRSIGYVPQDHLLFPHLSVQENLIFGVKRNGQSRCETEDRTSEVVRILELRSLLNRRVGQLSGGQRQRVSLGRALCSSPELLLLDEPLSALDHALRNRLLMFLLRVREHFRIPLILVSHQPVEIQAICDETLCLHAGRLVSRGLPDQVFARSPESHQDGNSNGFENVFTARVVEQSDHSTQVNIDALLADGTLTIPKTGGTVGDTVLVGLPADDILISQDRVLGISARNQLFGTVSELVDMGDKLRLFARCARVSGKTLVADLTPEGARELELQVGTPVWLIIKTNSINVYG